MVAITSAPANPTTATTATFAFTTANASAVSCSLDAAAATACSGSITYSGLAVGAHTFKVFAAAGAVSDSKSFAWSVTAPTPPPSGSPPSVAITSAPANPTTATSATFAFSATNASTVSCSLDAVAATACSGSITYSGLAVGAHTFKVVVVGGGAGAVSASASFAWSVTTPPPVGNTGVLANAWVDANGGTCAASSNPTTYNDTAACGTFQAALASLPAAGGTILVKCGTYGPQTLTTTGKTGMTTISSETSRCATVEANGGIAVAFGNGVGNVALDHLTIDGMIHGTSTTGIGNNHIVVSRSDINVGKKVDGPSVTFSVGNYISLIGNTIGPSCCGFNGGQGVSPVGIRIGKPNAAPASCTTQVCNLLIDDNTLQGVVRDCSLWPTTVFGLCPDTTCPNIAGCHEDGIQIWGVDGGTISRNRLYGVECQGIFIENTNASLQRDVSIVNNAIASLAGGCSNKGIYLSAGGTTDGATDGFAGTWTIAFNSGGGTLIGPNGCGSCWPGTTFRLVGNDMPLFVTNATGNSGGCTAPWGASTVTYLYNVWRSGGSNSACGATDMIANPAFVSQVNAPAFGNDYHLGAPGAADNYVPAAVCAAVTSQDFDGQSRPANANCDAGADDR